jgi:HAD superfamily hydrolase (TIGR01509 family)
LKHAVLFDWDGTLADTREVIVATFQRVSRGAGATVSAEFIERRIGTGAAQTFREILQAGGKHFDDTLIEKLLENKIQTEMSMSSRVKLFPGVLSLLKALQEKIAIALASMNNRPVIEDLLNSMKIRNLFKVVVTVEDVTKFKPDPEIFEKCATKLQCKPEECIVVEDSIFGVQAAKAAGMECIAVLTGVYSRDELGTANPGLIVNSLTERQRILDFIFSK